MVAVNDQSNNTQMRLRTSKTTFLMRLTQWITASFMKVGCIIIWLSISLISIDRCFGEVSRMSNHRTFTVEIIMTCYVKMDANSTTCQQCRLSFDVVLINLLVSYT